MVPSTIFIYPGLRHHRRSKLTFWTSKENILKSTLHIEHELGLGKKPNVVPSDDVKIDGEPRPVELGWHPVAGSAGKWFAEQTRLGRAITDEIHKCPDPTQHWAVLVGDYVHELWMDGMY